MKERVIEYPISNNPAIGLCNKDLVIAEPLINEVSASRIDWKIRV